MLINGIEALLQDDSLIVHPGGEKSPVCRDCEVRYAESISVLREEVGRAWLLTDQNRLISLEEVRVRVKPTGQPNGFLISEPENPLVNFWFFRVRTNEFLLARRRTDLPLVDSFPFKIDLQKWCHAKGDINKGSLSGYTLASQKF